MQKLQEYFSVIAKAGAVQRWSVQGLWVNTWFWQGEVQEGGAGSMSSWPWACLQLILSLRKSFTHLVMFISMRNSVWKKIDEKAI